MARPSRKLLPFPIRRWAVVAAALVFIGVAAVVVASMRPSELPSDRSGIVTNTPIPSDAAIATSPAAGTEPVAPHDRETAGAGSAETTDVDEIGVTAPESLAPQSVPAPSDGTPDWEQLARSVVQLWAPGCEQVGSGTIIGDGSLVLTNSHVLHAGGERGGQLCEVNVGITRSFSEPPAGWRRAEVVDDDPVRDLALVRLASAAGDAHLPLEVVLGELSLGDELTILGYPGFGQSQDTLTFTSGRFSGTTTFADGLDFYKTDALLDSGVSGGAVFDDRGQLIGVATGGIEGEGGHLGLVIPGSEVLRFLSRSDFGQMS